MTRHGIDEHTLLCERCGYVLEGLPRTGDCPECGRAIEASLPERRDRTPSAWDVLRHPRRSLDAMPIEPPRTHDRRMLTRSAVAAGIAVFSVPSAMAPFVLIEEDIPASFASITGGLVIGALIGVLLFGVLGALTSIESFGLRVLSRRRGGRIDAAISGTICSHGSIGWVVSAVAFALGVWAVAIVSLIGVLTPPSNRPEAVLPSIAVAGVALSSLGVIAGFLLFEIIAWLGLRRCLYANRADPGAPTDPDSPQDPRDAPARRQG